MLSGRNAACKPRNEVGLQQRWGSSTRSCSAGNSHELSAQHLGSGCTSSILLAHANSKSPDGLSTQKAHPYVKTRTHLVRKSNRYWRFRLSVNHTTLGDWLAFLAKTRLKILERGDINSLKVTMRRWTTKREVTFQTPGRRAARDPVALACRDRAENRTLAHTHGDFARGTCTE